MLRVANNHRRILFKADEANEISDAFLNSEVLTFVSKFYC